MLVLDGHPVELDAHVARLRSSIGALYGQQLPNRIANSVLEQAAGVRHGRLRVTVIRGGDGWLRSRVSTAEVDSAAVFPGAGQSVSLHSVIAPGGLGAHKWADRRLLERAAAEIPSRGLPLLVDRDGDVLEVSRGNVFCAGRHGIATPPLDGRILPGIARDQVLEVARTEGIKTSEERLKLADLLRGDEVFIAGSVRGIEPVGSIDESALPTAGEISARIAIGLRNRWMRAPEGESVATASGARPTDRLAR
jgi:para-aminobenzoate synthetase/4-amino-4-deoxychorismate lyase